MLNTETRFARLYIFLNMEYRIGKFYDWKSSKRVSKVIVNKYNENSD
jgi:hypothetical protein